MGAFTHREHSVKLSPEQVRDIADLARLDLDDEEVSRFADQLSEVFAYFQRLQELDTAHIAPTASVLPLKNVMRPDESLPPLPPDQVVANAPDAEDNQFRVSAVLDD